MPGLYRFHDVNKWVKSFLWDPIINSARPRFCGNFPDKAQSEKWTTRKIEDPFAFDLPVPVELAIDKKVGEAFDSQRHTEFPARQLVCVPNASAIGGFVRLPSGEYLNESDWRRRDFLKSDISRARYIRHKVDLEGDTYYLDVLFSNNYAHWIADELPRLAGTLPALPESTRFITSDPLPDFKLKSLAALGIPENRLVPVKGFYQIRCERLWYATPANDMIWNPLVLARIKDRLLQAYACDGDPSLERLFISRSGARWKRLANEDELLPLIASHGFTVLDLEKTSFPEQVKCFARAKVILGAHGAGFTNLLFSTRARLLELQDNLFAPRLWYWKWATMLGHDYYTMTGPMTESKDWLNTSFTIHPDSLKEFFDGCLSSGQGRPLKQWWVGK
jgi:capsular polysaccharide biosynthesis protein